MHAPCTLLILSALVLAGCASEAPPVAPLRDPALSDPAADGARAEADAGAPTEGLVPLVLRLDATRGAQLPMPATAKGIGPGSRITTEIPGGDSLACTANFVWRDADGKTYLGAAGHCFLPFDKVATHGPGANYDASGVRTFVCAESCSFGGWTGGLVPGGYRELGRVVYARQSGVGENATDPANDFGLVEVPGGLLSELRPTLPVWGGPLTSKGDFAHTSLCYYGAGLAVGETFPTMARTGVGTRLWSNGAYEALGPVNFGDSGSAVVKCTQEGDGLRGEEPVGIITHGAAGLINGPTVGRIRELATEAGLSIEIVHG